MRDFAASPGFARLAAGVLLGLLACTVAFQVSVAGVYAETNPYLALKVAPSNADAKALFASQLVKFNDRKAIAQDLARDAVLRDPVQPLALRVLGEADDTETSMRRSRALPSMLEAERLSRRDPMTELWLAQHFGQAGFPNLMASRFDILLRSSESARPDAFPLLVAAASDPKIEPIVIRLLLQRPNWASAFVSYAVTSGSNLDFASKVAHLLLHPGTRDDRAMFETLMQRLAASGQYAAAWNVYQSPGLSPAGSAAKTIRNGDFETPEDGSPFDWNLSQAPELWSARERLPSANGSVLRLAAYNGSDGDVAQQLLHLRPGPHRLQTVVGDIPADRYERPQVQVECAQSRGGVLVGLSPLAYGAGPFTLSSQFTVPQDCSFQRISVRMAGQGAQHDPLPWIDDLRVD